LLLWGGGGLLVVVGLAVALAPTIGSALAPGMIEGSVNPGIKGRVKVDRASIGWFTGLAAGPVEVFDPQGERVASASVTAPVTLWQVVSGRYWSASRLDLGTIEVRGDASIKQYLDGTTSLDRAFSPRDGAPAKPSKPATRPGGGGGGSMPAVKATLKVTELNVSVRDEKDQFKSELGLKGFKGEAKIDADLGAAGGGVVKANADFSGRAASPGGGGDGQPMGLKLDADVKQTSAGTWTPDGIAQARVNLTLSNAPMRVIDALAGMGGAIVQGVGESADVNVDLDGNTQAMSGRVKMTSTGLNADATVSIKDGVFNAAAEGPSTVSLKSAAFIENLPQARAGVAKAGEQIRLSSAPSVQVVLEKLSVPLPRGAGADFKTLDLRGATVGLKVKVSELAGQVKLPGAAGGGADAAAGTWKPFTVSPIELAIDIPDLSKPVSIQTGTRATLDGRPAGEISLALSAEGLLNKHGRLRAMLGGGEAMADKAGATARVTGMSTALLQPVIAGAVKDLPIDLAIDVGPSLDLLVTANADVGGAAGAAAGEGLAALPPADVDAQVNSQNIQASVKGRLDKGVFSCPGEGVRVKVAKAAPLAQRILAASPKDAAGGGANGATTIALSGAGQIELIGRDLSLPLAGGGAEAILSKGAGQLSLAISDVNAAVDMGAGGSASPVRIDRHAVNLTLSPGAGPKVALDGKLSHDNQPFTITGEYALNGLSKGLPKSKGPGVLAEVNPTGAVEVKGLPRSLLAIVPATAGYASSAGVAADATEMTRAIANLVRETIGASADITLRLLAAAPDIGGGQLTELTVATPDKGAGVNTWARVSASEAELRLLNAFVRLTPESSNGVLRAMTATAPKPGEAATPADPMRLGAPVVVRMLVDKPVKVPLAAGPDGAVTPDWSKAGVLAAKIAAESDVVVDNVAIGGGAAGAAARPTVLALRGVQADVAAPLAGVPDSARATHRASVKLSAQALNRTAGEALIAKLTADASAMMNGSSPEAVVKVTDVGGVAVGDLLAMRDKFVGAVGETAEASLIVKPGAGGAGTVGEVIEVVMEVTSPRISGAKVSLAKDDQRLWLTAPSTVTWTPNVAMLNDLISAGTQTAPAPPPGRRPRGGGGGQGGAAAAGSGFTIEQMQPISVNIERLGIGMGAADASGQATAGPLKPGLFEVGLSARAPSMNALVNTGQAGQPPTKLAIEGLSVSVASAKAAAGAAGPNPLELNLNVDRIGGVGATTGKRSTASVQVANLADARGVVNADAAVVNADIDIESFPTPIVDKLANQGGVLTELLGPTVTLKAQGRNVSRGGGAAGGAAAAAGNLTVQATSQRATAEVKGDVKGGRFVQTGPVKVVIREIRNELVKALAGSVPIIETLEKTPPDEPATIETSGLTVPLDNDLRKLNGRVAVDMGIARFTTNSLLGDLIKGLGGRESGSIGKKVEPFVVNIKDGVATYERFRLPVGEFFIETRGTVDLVTRQMDVVTYAPIGALTDKAIGKLGAPITGRLNEVLQVPFTTKGSMDDPQRLYPDVGLFLKEAGQSIIKDPGKIIGDVIGDVFKPKEPKK
jgi:hypothetical protein